MVNIMGKTNTGLKVVIGVLLLAFGASVTYSAVPAVKEWTDGIIERIVVRPSEEVSEEPSSEIPSEELSEEPSEEPSEEVPVLVEKYQIIFSKEQNFYISFRGPGLSGSENAEQLFLYGNIVSLTITEEKLAYVFGPIDIQEDYYSSSLSIYAATGDNSGSWSFMDNDEELVPFGIYDFSAIVITEANQVLTPVYTPVYQ